jgi:hypothetical protein
MLLVEYPYTHCPLQWSQHSRPPYPDPSAASLSLVSALQVPSYPLLCAHLHSSDPLLACLFVSFGKLQEWGGTAFKEYMVLTCMSSCSSFSVYVHIIAIGRFSEVLLTWRLQPAHSHSDVHQPESISLLVTICNTSTSAYSSSSQITWTTTRYHAKPFSGRSSL